MVGTTSEVIEENFLYNKIKNSNIYDKILTTVIITIR